VCGAGVKRGRAAPACARPSELRSARIRGFTAGRGSGHSSIYHWGGAAVRGPTRKEGSMQARYKLFSSAIKSWEDLCDEAAAFATEVGPQRLINISVSAAGGQNFFGSGAEGVIYVWYWE
jgi:hypothetical protein